MLLLGCVLPDTADSAAGSTEAGPGRGDGAAAPDTGPFGEADPDPAGCRIRLDYDDDADGVVDRFSEVVHDELGQWTVWNLDDGTYTGSFTATWEDGCATREEGALVDDEGDDWAITLTRDCGAHGESTRETEVWAETQAGGGSVVYGDTTRWTWTWEGDRFTAVWWTSNDGETTHAQTWSWTGDRGPDTSEVDWLSDGVVDERQAWTWDEDGDCVTEQIDDQLSTWTRDTRDRITTLEVAGVSSSTWVYLGPGADWPWAVHTAGEGEAVTWWTADCP